MKKKILLLIFCLIILIVVFRVYQYNLLLEISNKADEIIRNNMDGHFSVDDGTVFYDVYQKDGVTVEKVISKNEENGEDIYETWTTTNKDEVYNLCYKVENSLVKEYATEERIDSLLEGKKAYNKGFYFVSTSENANMVKSDNPIVNKFYSLYNKIGFPVLLTTQREGEPCYLMLDFWGTKKYISMKTYLPIYTKQGSKKIIYKYDENVLEENLNKIEPDENMIVSFNDIDYKTDTIKQKSEKAISGTELDVGEELVENVLLKSGENLDILDLTANEYGVKSFSIYNLEVYNNFRKSYSGLRELTEEDFENYYVSIAYNRGYRLNHLQSLVSEKSKGVYYIVSSEKVDNKELLLSIVPRENKYIANYIEYDEQLNVDSKTASEKAEERLDKLKNVFKIEEDEFILKETDNIARLDNNTFSNMKYIERPIAGRNPLCWIITYYLKTSENAQITDKVTIYIDSNYGDIIGALLDRF